MLAMRGCVNREAPDERLAGRLDKLCVIARDSVDAPERGVRKLGRYLGEHTGDMLKDFGDTIATIEKITDDAKHDDRARLARDRIHGAACPRDWQRFGDAVDRDPAAHQLLIEMQERLSRTFEILFKGARLDVRELPQLLEAI